MTQIIATEFKVHKFTDTMKCLPQAPSYFQKTVFQKVKSIIIEGYVLKSGQICEHAQSQTINCVTAVTKCITTIELY